MTHFISEARGGGSVRLGLSILATVALLVSLFVAAAPAFASNPNGNNGTVKVDGTEFDNHSDNEPHVSCSFEVDFYGYDEGDLWADVTFEAQPPSGIGELLTDRIFIGEDDNSGAGSEAGLDASRVYDLTDLLSAYEAHPNQGYHVRLTINADGSQGGDVKHKVFWVGPCTLDTEPPGGDDDDKIGICHATGSDTNPYVFVEVSLNAVNSGGHGDHEGDILGVESAENCPGPVVTEPPGGDDDDDKIGICHATGSDTNPYVFVEVSVNAVNSGGHGDHEGDILGVESLDDCVDRTETEPPTVVTTPPSVPESPAGGISGATSRPRVVPNTAMRNEFFPAAHVAPLAMALILVGSLGALGAAQLSGAGRRRR
ncbi:MAG: hypothetical protein M3295_05255 [Chloroflexota bacterium]|nr:hypothetical protein [Chloroflexota bacterium]